MKTKIQTVVSAAQPPVTLNGTPGRRSATRFAAGAMAIAESMRYGFKESGVARTVNSALKMNQVAGFDCQSCAWPNPDDHRSVAEFCENGFKAAAYEADTKWLTRGRNFSKNIRSPNSARNRTTGWGNKGG